MRLNMRIGINDTQELSYITANRHMVNTFMNNSAFFVDDVSRTIRDVVIFHDHCIFIDVYIFSI